MKRTLFALAMTIAAMPAVAQDIISTVAGNGTATNSGDGGPAMNAGINRPQQIALIPGGGYYVISNAQLRKVDANGLISTIAGNGTPGSRGDGGPAAAASLSNQPAAVRRAADGSVYIADTSNLRIRKIGTDGIIHTVAGNGTATANDHVAGIYSGLNLPTGIDLDANGNVYIAEYYGCRIRKLDAEGAITTIAGTGECATSGDGGAASEASLNRPWGLRLDKAGNMYISECYGDRIRKIDAAGQITTVAGSEGIACPLNVDFDVAGNLYVAAFAEHRVYQITPAGVATVFAGNGSQGFSGDAGVAPSAQLNYPRDVAVASDRVYVSDGSNNRVRMVQIKKAPPPPATTTCASEGYRGTQLQWCVNICESRLSGRTLDAWIQRWLSRYRELPYCAK